MLTSKDLFLINKILFKAAALATAAFIFLGHKAAAEDAPGPGFPYEVPLIDFPYDFGAGGPDGRMHLNARWPSMNASLGLSVAAYTGVHYGLGRILDPYSSGWKGFGHRMAYVGVDVLMTYLPLGNGWLHEEFHRAVMGRRGIGSHDGVYYLNIGSPTISVDHVTDENLERLKRTHPSEQVRLSEAGIEGENVLVSALEKEALFDDGSARDHYNQTVYWLTYFNIYEYVSSGATTEADKLTDDFNAKESTVAVRDFAGHDFTAWVYDLFRPDEPYAARGTHPSGTGINRYRRYSDLSVAEQRYLAWMGQMTLLNFVDGSLFRDAYATNGGSRVNGSLKHYLTPFGFAVDANWLTRCESMKLALTVHEYRNQNRAAFGAEAAIERYEAIGALKGLASAVSARVGIWRQPARQRFDDLSARAGGIASMKIYFPSPFLTRRMETFVELERKGPGWVAGNVDLGAATSARVGVAGRLF